MIRKEIIVVGAGPAGMAAALKLWELGFRDLLVIEKGDRPGGVLNQCIHPGFGLTKLKKNLTGPEYAYLFESRIQDCGIRILKNSTVLEIREHIFNKPNVGEQACSGAVVGGCGGQRVMTTDICGKAESNAKCCGAPVELLVQQEDGRQEYLAEAVILASGCRETGRGFLEIPGSRPAGIYSAGSAQAMMNLHNMRIGHKIVIVGSGDIGLIMARRFTLEGSQVLCVVEKEAVCGGLERNRRECLEDFDIPLITRAQLCDIRGKRRVEAVVVRDSTGKETLYSCDTVILSAGLVPEERMVSQTMKGLFYCGNALYVHDLVDDVTDCGEAAATDAAGYLIAKMKGKDFFSEYQSENVPAVRRERRRLVAERRLERQKRDIDGRQYIICTMCPNGCRINPVDFSGGKCDRGAVYAKNELANPRRVLTSSVRINGTEQIVSVRTTQPILKRHFAAAMELINNLKPDSPVRIGDILAVDFTEKGCSLVATASWPREV